MKDAFGNELNVGDMIIVAVPLYRFGPGYSVAKGIVKGFTKKYVKYEIVKNGPLRGGIAKATFDKVGKSFEICVPNCVV